MNYESNMITCWQKGFNFWKSNQTEQALNDDTHIDCNYPRAKGTNLKVDKENIFIIIVTAVICVNSAIAVAIILRENSNIIRNDLHQVNTEFKGESKTIIDLSIQITNHT